jgi:hypothetical protein
VSRAGRRYEKWGRETRNWAWESARELAPELYYRRAGAINPYGIGVDPKPDEVVYRQVWARYCTLAEPPEPVGGFGRGGCGDGPTRERGVTRLPGQGEEPRR